MFDDLPRLQRLRLASNRLTDIDPDTFRGASDLSLLDLSNNPIKLRDEKSFLNQPSLLELNCRNCSWTDIYEDTFKNTPHLTALRIDNNDFNKVRMDDNDLNKLTKLKNLYFKRINVNFANRIMGVDVKCT